MNIRSFEQGRLMGWAAQGLREVRVGWAASPPQTLTKVGPTIL